MLKANRLRFACGTTALGALFALATPAAAKDCGAIAKLQLDHGKITAAELVAPGAFKAPPSPFPTPPGVKGTPYDNLPAFCRVQATLTPTSDSDIKVEVWLPAENWNGKYVGLGNGIWAGQLSISQIPQPLSQGYAVATTDTGHSGRGTSGEFAVGHPEKLIDFGYRAVHEMTLAAKAVIADYYGAGPRHSFWDSCSTGGRQGLMEAYRYPEDYDAISAMDPANPMTGLMAQTMWAGFFPRPPRGERIDLPLLAILHKAVVANCDSLDGLKDGIIANPEACHFDPAVLQCKPGQKDNCLTAGQVAVMDAIYDGVRDSNGKILLPGFERGSEGQLSFLLRGDAPYPVALTYFQLLVHGGDRDWDWKNMDFGKELQAARTYGSKILDVPYDGLGPFFARGGKLLLGHGWADWAIPSMNSVDFYRKLYHALPLEQAQNQLRLFMVPGMGHCSGGEGATVFAKLPVIDKWVETGIAPSRIVAKRTNANLFFPNAPKLPPLSRPLCAYPLIPTYNGEGDDSDAANFTCAAAPK